MEGSTLECDNVVKYKEELEAQHVTIILVKECSWKTQMLSKGVKREQSLNKRELDTFRRELLSTEFKQET